MEPLKTCGIVDDDDNDDDDNNNNNDNSNNESGTLICRKILIKLRT